MAEPEPFSHAVWTEVLQRFVDDEGLVDYAGLAADRGDFDQYVGAVEAVSPKSHPERFSGRDEALAYYINAYNALVFQGVLERGPETKSVWRGLISGYAFFVSMKVTVGGEKISLKALEDDIVRAEFQDPRIHAALNCASIGCPRLPQEAFDPATLDAQLDATMQEFVSDPRHVAVEAKSRRVRLSKIFDWFTDDFLDEEKRQGRPKANLIDYVNRYRSPDSQIPRDYSIRFLPYDKGINQQ
ncbi:MAG: DUF547 domain-containing protein [Acidobacteriota bacterium]